MRGVLNNGHAGFSERDGAGQCREHHEQEEQEAHDRGNAAHLIEHVGQDYEHQRRAGLRGNSLGGAHSHERCRHDHQTSQEGIAGIEELDTTHGLLKVVGLLHVGAIRDHNAHGQRQAVEHLTKCGNDQLNAELAKVRRQIICQAINCTGERELINADAGRHNQQHRHKDTICTLDAVLHAQRNNSEHDQQECNSPDEALAATADEVGEVRAAIGKRRGPIHKVRTSILEYPTADDAVIRHDDERNRRSKDANEGVFLPERLKGTKCTLPSFATKCRLKHHQREAERDNQHHIGDKEHTTAILRSQVRETPKISQSDSRSRSSQNKRPLARPRRTCAP